MSFLEKQASAQHIPATARYHLEQEYSPDTPHNEIEAARLKLAVGALALEYATAQGADDITSKRFARKISRSDIPALLGFRTLLTYSLHMPSELHTRPDITGSEIDDKERELATADVRQDLPAVVPEVRKKRSVWRVRNIDQCPPAVTEIRGVIDYYFPGTHDQQLPAISKMAIDLREDLIAAPDSIPNNLSRAMVLLLKARELFRSEKDDLLADEVTRHTNSAFEVFMDKTKPMVERIVYKLNNPSHALSGADLVIEGQIGLMDALNRYDLRAGVDKNVLYWCYNRIHGQATDEIRQNGYIIRRSREDFRIANMQRDTSADGDNGLSEKHLEQAAQAEERLWRSNVIYLDARVSLSSERTYLDVVAEKYGSEELDDIETVDVNLDYLVSTLSHREQQIIKMRFGISPYERDHTMSDIADVVGVTESRVSQIVKKTLDKLEVLASPNSENTSYAVDAKTVSALENLSIDYSKARVLSGRQLEILNLISTGLTDNEIAERLVLSGMTVKSHVKKILKNLGVSSRTRAVSYVFANGVFSVSEIENDPPPNLTKRRGEILQLVFEGLENDQIAGVLRLSIDTVKTQVRNILKDLDARNRTHAVRRGFEMGLLSAISQSDT